MNANREIETKAAPASKMSWWWKVIPPESRQLAAQTVAEGSYTCGPRVSEAEEIFQRTLGLRTSVFTNSGTSALIMALIACGVRPGDEVIVPALTWIASAQAAALLGARAVAVDVEYSTLCLDPAALSDAITPATKVIMPVFFNGHSPRMQPIYEIADPAGILVVQDRCKAMGTTFLQRKLKSSLSRYVAFSLGMFSPVSIGYGGVVGSMKPQDQDFFRKLRDHGMIRDPEKYEELSQNFKVSDILAAMAPDQIIRLSQFVESASLQEARYADALRDSPYGHVVRHSDNECGTYVLFLAESKEVSRKLISAAQARNVTITHYHPPIFTAPYVTKRGSCAVTRDLFQRLLHVPCGPDIPEQDVERAIQILK